MDDAGFVTNDTGYIITGESISYLQEQLTSPEMWFAFNKFYMGGGVSKEFKVNNLLALPVPKEGSSLIFTEEEKLVIKMWNQM